MYYAYVSALVLIFKRQDWTKEHADMQKCLLTRYGAIWSYCDGVIKSDYLDAPCILNEPAGRVNPPRRY